MAFDKDHDGLKREFSANLQSFGQNGFKVISSPVAVNGEFVAITALSDSMVYATLPDGMSDYADALLNDIIPAGVTVYGKFTSVAVNSGKVIAYNLTEG